MRIDEGAVGLDPRTSESLVPLLKSIAFDSSLQIVISSEPRYPIPSWVTHVLCLGANCSVRFQGPKGEVLARLEEDERAHSPDLHVQTGQEGQVSSPKNSGASRTPDRNSEEEAIVQMKGIQVKYGQRTVIGDWYQSIDGTQRPGLSWTIRRGDRWGLFGPNGSGKTTLLSLMSSDHPQSYSLPIELFGRSRLPRPQQPGISIFDLQARIGQSSPEIYNFFPRNHTVRRTVESAWADTFVSKPTLTPESAARVDACLRFFRAELRPQSIEGVRKDDGDDLAWATTSRFRDLSFAAQKVVLFIRAIIKIPDLVILDEAFSGMDEGTRNKCMAYLANRVLDKQQALVCVSHRPEEIPDMVDRWICLPESGSKEPPRVGKLNIKDRQSSAWWDQIWGLSY